MCALALPQPAPLSGGFAPNPSLGLEGAASARPRPSDAGSASGNHPAAPRRSMQKEPRLEARPSRPATPASLGQTPIPAPMSFGDERCCSQRPARKRQASDGRPAPLLWRVPKEACPDLRSSPPAFLGQSPAPRPMRFRASRAPNPRPSHANPATAGYTAGPLWSGRDEASSDTRPAPMTSAPLKHAAPNPHTGFADESAPCPRPSRANPATAGCTAAPLWSGRDQTSSDARPAPVTSAPLKHAAPNPHTGFADESAPNPRPSHADPAAAEYTAVPLWSGRDQTSSDAQPVPMTSAPLEHASPNPHTGFADESAPSLTTNAPTRRSVQRLS